ncbi:CAP-associated domain-containing protein [Jeotgalibacillus sp. R-1-5s-1]|uniref:CAP domain-containing protein n=1 Tax=Jeotgalibacillus sp. R-1-5s-1 TaxID=2555897 RepID=UPI0010698E4F|nr:CAP-associated domain-containing protein [Jeotgalibacillus sp. R-1-5s-1]TFD95745.1 serine protease [Jeotgalibacillus sp. R-1-5s-1]
MKKTLAVALSLFIFLSYSPAQGSAADCGNISSDTIIWWDGVELKVGQIGRLTVISDTPLYVPRDGRKSFSRMLKSGEKYRIYNFAPGMLGLGGGYFVDRDERVTYETPSSAKKAQIACKVEAQARVNQSVKIGESVTIAEGKLPDRQSVTHNDYGLSWFTYHNNYHRFYMISYQNNKVAGLYTIDKDFRINGVKVGDAPETVRVALGSPREASFPGKQAGYETFSSGGNIITVFYDQLNKQKVTAFLVTNEILENSRSKYYADPSPQLAGGFEKQLFDLVNAKRVREGFKALKPHDKIAATARKHSADMAVNNYFAHNNLKGETPFDRMRKDGIVYRVAGENLAKGYRNSIFAHEALMNSSGHRPNVLSDSYTHLGVGVAFSTAFVGEPYYTENYILPWN